MSALLVVRLYLVQIREGAGLAANASEEQQATFQLNPKRGDIVDRFGTVFATTLPSYDVYVQPPDVTVSPADVFITNAPPAVNIEPAQVTVEASQVQVDVHIPETLPPIVNVEPPQVDIHIPEVEAPVVQVDVHVPEPKTVTKTIRRDAKGAITHIEES